MTPATRLRGPLPDQVVARARGALIRRLYRHGLPDLFGPEERPLATGVLMQLLNAKRSTVTRAIATDRPVPEPAAPAGP